MMLFDVRLISFEARGGEDPTAALVRLFAMDRSAARNLLKRLPHPIKRGLTREAAERLARMLQRVGATTELVVSQGDARVEQPAQAQRMSAQAAPVAVETPFRKASANGVAVAAINLRRESVQQANVAAQPARYSAQLPEPAPARHTQAEQEPQPSPDLAFQDDDEPVRSSMAQVPSAARMPPHNDVAAHPAAAASGDSGPQRAPAPVEGPRPPVEGPRAPVEVARPGSALPPVKPEAVRALARAIEGPRFSVLRPSAAAKPLPTFAVAGPPVVAASLVSSDTFKRVRRSALLFCLAGVLLGLATFGTVLILYLLVSLYDWLRSRLELHHLQRSAIAVSQSQLSELYHCAKQFALRLDLPSVPRVFVKTGMERSAEGFVAGEELVIVLSESFVERAIEAPRPEVLSFAIAHELARHALGLTRPWRRVFHRLNADVSCLELASADAVAVALVNDRELAQSALLFALAGPVLGARLNPSEVDRAGANLIRDGFGMFRNFMRRDEELIARFHYVRKAPKQEPQG